MGLDIKFNLELAKQAGLTVSTEVIGTDEEILAADTMFTGEPTNANKEHLEWLKSIEIYGRLPNYPSAFDVDDSVEGYAIVRANKWGNLYAPLTEFLKNNNITWEEH
jgi:hypothetical protein